MSTTSPMDDFSFAGLDEGLDNSTLDGLTPMDELPPASKDNSGMFTLESIEMQARMEEQKRLQELYTLLLDVTNLFTDPLVPGKKEKSGEGNQLPEMNLFENVEKLRLWVSVYMNQVAEILKENNISDSANFIKLLDGLRGEFETILSYGERYGTLDSEVVKTRIGNISRVFSNLNMALLAHRNEAIEWKDFDETMPDMLGVSALDIVDVSAIEMEIACAKTHDEVMNALPEVKDKIDNPAPYRQAKLDKYAAGEASVYNINEEKAAWMAVQAQLRKLKRSAPKKVN